MRRAWALLGLAGVAAAQAGPPTRPLRDVVATYAVSGAATELVPGGLGGPVRLSWDAAGQRVRAEAEGRSQVAVLDLRSRAGMAFDTTLRVSMPIKTKQLGPLALDGVALTAKGHETVAGLACTDYGFVSPEGPGEVCLTGDGVPLKGEGAIQGRPGRFTALSVRYGTVSPGLFVVPDGYVALGGGSGGGLGGLAERLGGSGIDLRGLLGRGR